jgi:hypothetical protein
MPIAHIYTVAFQGIEARRSDGQASAAKPSPARPNENRSGLQWP